MDRMPNYLIERTGSHIEGASVPLFRPDKSRPYYATELCCNPCDFLADVGLSNVSEWESDLTHRYDFTFESYNSTSRIHNHTQNLCT